MSVFGRLPTDVSIKRRIGTLAEQINSGMPKYVAGLVRDALNDNEKSVKGAKILILGVAYKKDIDDMRESPALAVIEHLQKRGAVDALNLDGGGSSSFYFVKADGTVVTNRPSDTAWRPVGNHLGFVRRAPQRN